MMARVYPTIHVSEPLFINSTFIAINGKIYRNTAAPTNAPILLKMVYKPQR